MDNLSKRTNKHPEKEHGLGHVTLINCDILFKHMCKTINAINFQFGAYMVNLSNISVRKKTFPARRAAVSDCPIRTDQF